VLDGLPRGRFGLQARRDDGRVTVHKIGHGHVVGGGQESSHRHQADESATIGLTYTDGDVAHCVE
jgi:hypothetical protein